MNRNLANENKENAGQLQGIPISAVAPTSGQVLQFISSTGLWTPEPVSALPSIQNIINVGSGVGILHNISSGTASLKSLTSNNCTVTDNGTSINIDSLVSSNIYTSNGTITGDRTVSLGGIYKLIFGQPGPSSPCLLLLDNNMAQIALDSQTIGIGSSPNTSTLYLSSVHSTVYGSTRVTINSNSVVLPNQLNGILKTDALGEITAGSNLEDLSNTNISSPTNNQMLIYNSGSNKWINSSSSSSTYYTFFSTTSFTTTFQILNNMDLWDSFSNTCLDPISPNNGDRFRYRGSNNLSFSNHQVLVNGAHLLPIGTILFPDTNTSTIEFEFISPVWVCISVLGEYTNSFDSTVILQSYPMKLSDLKDCNVSSPTTNQILQWNGSSWQNSNNTGGGTLIFSGKIMNGSTISDPYYWVQFATITIPANPSPNFMVTICENDSAGQQQYVWYVGYWASGSGTWLNCNSVNSGTYGNLFGSTYQLYVKNDSSNLSLFYLALQKISSHVVPSLNTNGYYLNIMTYNDPSNCSVAVNSSPTLNSGSALLSSSFQWQKKIVNNFNADDIASATLQFTYFQGYNLYIEVYASCLLPHSTADTMSVKLNGTTLISVGLQSSDPVGNQNVVCVLPLYDCDALSRIIATQLNFGSLANSFTFSFGVGDSSIYPSPYNVSIIQELF